jgi:amyloid beta precursor protein binding protein 1
MTSTTETYLRLQQLYREKAERDTNAVETHARRLLQSLGRDPQAIPHADIRNFVKNARNLRQMALAGLAALSL